MMVIIVLAGRRVDNCPFQLTATCSLTSASLLINDVAEEVLTSLAWLHNLIICISVITLVTRLPSGSLGHFVNCLVFLVSSSLAVSVFCYISSARNIRTWNKTQCKKENKIIELNKPTCYTSSLQLLVKHDSLRLVLPAQRFTQCTEDSLCSSR